MFPRSYGSKVCVGNWEEDRLVEQAREDHYLKRAWNGELLSQKINRVTTLLNDVVIPPVATDGLVHVGDSVKICHDGNGIEFNVSLSSDIPIQAFLQADPLFGPLSICAIKDGHPVKRNTFTIKQENSTCRKPLCFGETFFLSTSISTSDWYLASKMVSFGHSTEMTKHQNLFLSPTPSCYAQFKVLFPDPRWSLEKEGNPIPLNKTVVLNHVFTNQALAFEHFPTRTLFGEVYEVSVHTYSHRSKYQADGRNLWKLMPAHPIH